MKRVMLGVCYAAVAAVALCVATPTSAAAQSAVLRGTVRSDGGDPIVGANVYIIELNLQAATSDAGRFVLTVPGDRVRGQTLQLRARAVGFRPASRAVTLVAGEQTVDFQLVQDINRLEEIVVTGVLDGTEAARVPFSVARVDFASEVPVPAMDPMRALQGRVPGANVTSASGRPGAAASVILRGPTSINASGRGQGPLFIVDNVMINGTLPDINPSDIENVEVVKGAAASSLYGARAGNGVIQITTRRGRRAADGVSFNARTEYGGSDIEGDFPLATQTMLLMDPTQSRFCVQRAGSPICGTTIDWNAEAARINNAPGDFSLPPAVFQFDPQAVFTGPPLRNAFQAQNYPGRIFDAVEQSVTSQPITQTTLDATARFGSTNIFSSFGYLDQGGAIRFLNGYERYSGRLNVDQRIGDQWTLGVTTYYARATADGIDQEDGNGTLFFRLTRVPAIVDVLQRDTLGRHYIRPNLLSQGSQNENPLHQPQSQTDIQTTDRFLGGITLRYTPAGWMDVEGNLSYDLRNYTQDFFRDKGYRTTALSANNNGFIRQFANREQAYNASINTVLRHRMGTNLRVRWNFRALYDAQDQRDRQGSANSLGAVGVPDLDNAIAGQTLTSSSEVVREIGLSAGTSLDFFDGRYIVEGLIRRDGTSLFGADNRWATFGRFSVAWRASNESWWFGGGVMTDLKLRFSRGSAGGRPRFNAQYETFGVSTTGPTLGNQGNRKLRPEITTDNEMGADMELFRRVGVQLTHARSRTTDQILQVTLPAEKGFGQQWQNAATLENRTWELGVNVPLITRRRVNWSARFTYDQTRTTVAELTVPPFPYGPSSMFSLRPGERYGTFYGRNFLRSCAGLPAAWQTDCGVEGVSTFQFNDEGYLVYVGQGNNYRQGITNNLWQTGRFGCTNAAGAAVACNAAGAVVNTPWGVDFNWGMPIIQRDPICVTTPSRNCAAVDVPLGNALPDWSFSVSSNLQFGRLTVAAMLQGVMGRDVWNQGRHWSHLDFITSLHDQGAKSIETAKPIGYYWRTSPTDGASGIGGFYDILRQNSHFVEDASYAKLRELLVSYNVGPLGGVGNWTVSVVGRNLFTITNYNGFDPEVGIGGSITSSAAVNAIDAFTFPNTRTLSFAVSTSF